MGLEDMQWVKKSSQLEASKSSIKDLFNNLLNERKGFMYQITLKVMRNKYNPNWV